MFAWGTWLLISCLCWATIECQSVASPGAVSRKATWGPQWHQSMSELYSGEKGLVFSLVVSINLTWRKSFAVVLKQLQNKSTDNGHYSKFTVPMYPFLLNLSQHTEQHSAPLIHKKLKVGVGWGLYCLVCKSCVFKIRQNEESLFFSEVIWVEAVLELFLNSSYILQTQSYSQDIFSV